MTPPIRAPSNWCEPNHNFKQTSVNHDVTITINRTSLGSNPIRYSILLPQPGLMISDPYLCVLFLRPKCGQHLPMAGVLLLEPADVLLETLYQSERTACTLLAIIHMQAVFHALCAAVVGI